MYFFSEQVHPLCLIWVHPSRVAALSEKNKWERPKTEARQTQIHKTKHAKIISNNQTTISLKIPKKPLEPKLDQGLLCILCSFRTIVPHTSNRGKNKKEQLNNVRIKSTIGDKQRNTGMC